MKQLIVNADDFGYTQGVNRGIVEGHRSGIITSTSLMANGAAFENAVEVSKCAPGLDIGCHLNLVEGTPVSPPAEVPHLVGADGKFQTLFGLLLRLASGAVPGQELERECSAQVGKLVKAGIRPSHLDTHKHTHLHPRVMAAVAAAARRYSIEWVRRPFENCVPARTAEPWSRRMLARCVNLRGARFDRSAAGRQLRMPDFFTGFGLTGRWTSRAMGATLAALRPGVTELMCHPGYYDDDLEVSPTRLTRQRQTELEILAEPSWRARLNELGIVLSGFRNVSSAPVQAAEHGMLAVAAPAGGE